jgi:hypothetical protein
MTNTKMTNTSSRGFVIAIDALLALLILFSILSLSFDALQRDGRELGMEQQMSLLAYRTGMVLEQSGMASKAVITNSTTSIREFLNGFPSSICASVTVYPTPDTNEAAFIVAKSGCSTLAGEQETYRQGFMVASPPDANMYVSMIQVWVNRT